MSDSIYGIRGVSPFAATLQDRKQPRERQAPLGKPVAERDAADPDEAPAQPGAAPNRLDVTV